MTIHYRTGTLTGLALATCALIACSSGNNSNARKATATATRAAANASPTAAARPPTVPQTPAPMATISPEIEALGRKLLPLLIQTPELPASMRNLQQTGVFPSINEDYAKGQPNASEIAARLVKDGRVGGVQTSWSPVGQFQPGQKVVNAVVDGISEFTNIDGAKDGLALIFSQISAVKTAAGDPTVSMPLDAGTYGDESQAYRVETSFTGAVAASPTPINMQIKQVVYIAAFRRGSHVAYINLSALNTDPSVDDLKQLLQLQDQKLQAAGF